MNVVDVISGSAKLGGVQWLLLASTPRKRLRLELGALLPAPEQLLRCRVRRATFKPGRRLTACYDVDLRLTEGGMRPRRPIAVTWSSDAERDGDTDGVLADAVRRGISAPFRELEAEIPAWRMRIQISPMDTQFPHLVCLSDPVYVRKMLSPGGGQNSQYSVTPIRYRPGQRHVLRYDPPAGSRSVPVFAKLYRGNSGERAWRIAELLSGWLGGDGTGIAALKPLAYLSCEQVILYPRAPGTPLSSHLSHAAPAPARQLNLAGAALRRLHCAPRALTEAVEAQSFEEELRAILRAGQHLQVVCPPAGASLATLVDRAREVHQRLAHEPAVFVHGDFKADHLWLGREGLTLIDFDSCRMADPAADIGKFLADLRWWCGALGAGVVEDAQAQFLAGYAPHPERMRLARIYEALALAKITIRRVRLFEHDWGLRTENLIASANRLLSRVHISNPRTAAAACTARANL